MTAQGCTYFTPVTTVALCKLIRRSVLVLKEFSAEIERVAHLKVRSINASFIVLVLKSPKFSTKRHPEGGILGSGREYCLSRVLPCTIVRRLAGISTMIQPRPRQGLFVPRRSAMRGAIPTSPFGAIAVIVAERRQPVPGCECMSFHLSTLPITPSSPAVLRRLAGVVLLLQQRLFEDESRAILAVRNAANRTNTRTPPPTSRSCAGCIRAF